MSNMKEYTSMKVKTDILKEMQEMKEESGVALYKIFEKAWKQYKESKEGK